MGVGRAWTGLIDTDERYVPAAYDTIWTCLLTTVERCDMTKRSVDERNSAANVHKNETTPHITGTTTHNETTKDRNESDKSRYTRMEKPMTGLTFPWRHDST